ncbi:hypothetical protein HDU76_006461 [Blyttiomyces sp. JEL0837]|nr:hypothetical protein HDU76_006461 [Blyttiomyces sp. JEL0837]
MPSPSPKAHPNPVSKITISRTTTTLLLLSSTILSSLPVTTSQVFAANCGSSNAAFDKCITDALKLPGTGTAATPEEFCQHLTTNQGVCYQSLCSTDPSFVSVKTSSEEYCSANATTNAMPTVVSNSSSLLPSTTITSVMTSAVSSSGSPLLSSVAGIVGGPGPIMTGSGGNTGTATPVSVGISAGGNGKAGSSGGVGCRHGLNRLVIGLSVLGVLVSAGLLL